MAGGFAGLLSLLKMSIHRIISTMRMSHKGLIVSHMRPTGMTQNVNISQNPFFLSWGSGKNGHSNLHLTTTGSFLPDIWFI